MKRFTGKRLTQLRQIIDFPVEFVACHASQMNDVLIRYPDPNELVRAICHLLYLSASGCSLRLPQCCVPSALAVGGGDVDSVSESARLHGRAPTTSRLRPENFDPIFSSPQRHLLPPSVRNREEVKRKEPQYIVYHTPGLGRAHAPLDQGNSPAAQWQSTSINLKFTVASTYPTG
jgi:hypothetical protein